MSDRAARRSARAAAQTKVSGSLPSSAALGESGGEWLCVGRDASVTLAGGATPMDARRSAATSASRRLDRSFSFSARSFSSASFSLAA